MHWMVSETAWVSWRDLGLTTNELLDQNERIVSLSDRNERRQSMQTLLSSCEDAEFNCRALPPLPPIISASFAYISVFHFESNPQQNKTRKLKKKEQQQRWKVRKHFLIKSKMWNKSRTWWGYWWSAKVEAKNKRKKWSALTIPSSSS